MRIISNKKVIHICVLVLSSLLSAQNQSKKDLLEFYPYNIGNSWSYLWLYHNVELDYYEAGRDKIVISKDTIVNNVKYWLIKYDNQRQGHYSKYLERIDSITGNVLRIVDLSSGEIDCVDNLYAKVGDTISISNNRDLLYCNKLVVKSIHDTIINNFQTTIREVKGIPYSRKLLFARKIGLLGSGKNYWIDSAKVNGIIFSHITDIHEKNYRIVTQYYLQQNYPNPFNPTTTIQYQILKPGLVTLNIYDVNGREVQKLVSREHLPGSYSSIFDGSNLASGVYYYQLKSNELIQTKKMLLLK